MGKFKSKAEQRFEERVQEAMRVNDWQAVEKITLDYEAYLRLTGDHTYLMPVERVVISPEGISAYSDEHRQWCIDTLERDPDTLLPLKRVRDERGNT